ncbi:probable cytochrome P450 313a4 [Musca autumnalis]|uniref:probable cytochrome P450 313a4 n=1 Tax=Musca autumnalis TaxID=221902 RepID=UPI003CEAE34E
MEGMDYLQHRKLMSEAFKYSTLIEFIPVFNRRANELFEDIDKYGYMENSHDILRHCREFTVKIACETMLGRVLNTKDIDITTRKYYTDLVSRDIKYVSDISFTFIYFNQLLLKLANLTVFKDCRKAIHALIRTIDKTLKDFSRGEFDSNYTTSIYAAVNCLDNAIKSNIIPHELGITSMIQIFFGAFETTSSTIYFTILMLAMHPEFQSKAYDEICKIFPDNDDGEVEVTYEDIAKLEYLDMCIKETMRLLPTIPQTGRCISGGNLTLNNGLVLPEGLDLIINIYNLHRNKKIWGPNAEMFIPENFLRSNVEKRHPYAYIPFGKGIRYCLGMRYGEVSLRVAIAKLIKRYKFSTTAKIEDLVFENHLALFLSKNPPLSIEKRT